MRTDIPRPLSDIGTPTAMLWLVGAAMLLAGFLYPGRQAAAATTFIVTGAGMVAVGVLRPRIRELEIGPFKTKIADDSVPLKPILDIQADKLTRFAHLVSGDADHARELVEEALAHSRQRQRRQPSTERDLFAIRTLIELLDTARERSWLRGSQSASPTPAEADLPAPTTSTAVVGALQRLPFAQRVAFVLRADWTLRIEEIATVLERPTKAVSDDISSARETLAPYLSMEARAADAY